MITIGGIIVGFQFGIYGLLIAQVILSFIFFIINAHYTDKFINYSAWEQIKDILPIILIAIAAGGGILYVDISIANYSDLVRIIGGGLVGTLFYLLISYLFKINSLFELKTLIFKSF